MHADLVVHRALVASLEEQAAEADLESSEMIGELMSTEHQLQKRLGVTRNITQALTRGSELAGTNELVPSKSALVRCKLRTNI